MCDTLVALAPLTARGGALFAKNSDRERNESQALELTPARRQVAGAPLRCTYITIPDVAHTYACLLSRPFWMWGAEIGANEKGVVVGNEALHASTPAQRRRALIGMDLVRLALERAASAAEAVQVIVGLLEAHGQGGDCGHLGRFYYNNGFIIADAGAAYVLETVGRDWVLQQVRGARALSNAYSIGRDYDAVSPGLAAQAQAQGLADAKGRFDVADHLLDTDRDAVSFGRGRCARGQALLDADAPTLTPQTMMAILRDHGEAADWSPANTTGRTICMHAAQGPRRSQSVASMVSELAPGRTVHWVTGTSAPCTSLFKPVVLGSALPAHGPAPSDRADGESLWWRHERLHRAMLNDFDAAHESFTAERDALEASFVARMDRAFADGGIEEAVAACWGEATVAEDRWRAALPAAQTPEAGAAAHRRSWARLNQVAGLARS